MKILNHLGKIRYDKKLTLRQVGDLTGVNCSTIERIENGEVNPTQIIMLKIAKGLNMETNEVFILDWRNIEF